MKLIDLHSMKLAIQCTSVRVYLAVNFETPSRVQNDKILALLLSLLGSCFDCSLWAHQGLLLLSPPIFVPFGPTNFFSSGPTSSFWAHQFLFLLGLPVLFLLGPSVFVPSGPASFCSFWAHQFLFLLGPPVFVPSRPPVFVPSGPPVFVPSGPASFCSF